MTLFDVLYTHPVCAHILCVHACVFMPSGLEPQLHVAFCEVTRWFDNLPSGATSLECGTVSIPIIDFCLKMAWKT